MKNTKTKKLTKHKLVTVKWEDAVAVTSVSEQDILNRPEEIVETYGHLIKTKKYHIVMTHNSHGEDNDYLRIPNGIVKEVI